MTATMLIWNYATACFNFIFVAILDVGRFLKMVQLLHSMIRLSDLMIDTSVSVQTTKTISEDERKNAKRRLDALLDICDTEHEATKANRMQSGYGDFAHVYPGMYNNHILRYYIPNVGINL
jgi:hypothetical protein